MTAAREVATEFGLMYFDSYAYMQANGDGTLISGDNIHPNDTGHGVIAAGILETTDVLNQAFAPSITSWAASGTDLVLSWAPVAGATAYEVCLVDVTALTVGAVIAATGTKHTFPAPVTGTYTAMVCAGSWPWTVATGQVTL